MDSRRAQRVSEALREELAEIIGYELNDPRLAAVSVTDALLSPDGRHTRVLVTFRGTADEQRQALEALEGAKNYLRSEIAVRLRLFRAPELNFEEDSVAGGVSRVEELLQRIRKKREKAENSGGK